MTDQRPYDWEDDAQRSWELAVACQREQHLVDTIPGVKRARVIGRCELMLGDCLEVLRAMPDNSADSIVTDPPYGLSFMGKAWDKSVPGVEVWREALRVLKPGGHLLAFAGTRTQHRMATAIEDAGFEIRDMICWVYGSGFPKSANVSKQLDKAAGAEREVVGSKLDLPGYHLNGHADTGKYGHGVGGSTPETRLKAAQISAPATPATPEAQQWDGWGTALKPALEPITVARKPLAKGNTVAANVLAHGTGALNVDGCRVGESGARNNGRKKDSDIYGDFGPCERVDYQKGRWPANLIHDGSDEVVGLFPVADSARASGNPNNPKRGKNHKASSYSLGDDSVTHDYRDTGSAARFFKCCPMDEGDAARFMYCAKASKKDRGEDNIHSTVKPTDLMRYLCRLVTPPGGTVLDPFMGSGSTGKACVLEGFGFIGIDVDPGYVEIARARIAAAQREADKPTQEGFDL